MYSVIVDGKVEDIHYKKMELDDLDVYAVYVGETHVGQVFRIRDRHWAAVSKTPHDLTPIYGFGSRMSAVEVILKIEGYH